MATHYTCDRCGQKIGDDKGQPSTVDVRRTGPEDRSTYELCGPCDAAFQVWVDAGVKATG